MDTSHRLYYRDWDEVLSGSSGAFLPGTLNPELTFSDYNLDNQDSTGALWNRVLHEASVKEAVAAVPVCNQGHLDLSHRGLIDVPDEVWALRETISVLQLEGNQIGELDENEIAMVTGLRALLIGENSLTELPASIGELIQLRVLHLSNNRISHIPESLGLCNRMTTLCLDGNELGLFASIFGEHGRYARAANDQREQV